MYNLPGLFLPSGRAVQLLTNLFEGCTACNAARCGSEWHNFSWRWLMSMWLGLPVPETFHDVLQIWTVINTSSSALMLYWIHPIDAADRLAAKPELAEKFCFQYERQESEQRPSKQAFGRSNSELVFQEEQLTDMYYIPFIHWHLFYRNNHFPDSTAITIQAMVPVHINMQYIYVYANVLITCRYNPEIYINCKL